MHAVKIVKLHEAICDIGHKKTEAHGRPNRANAYPPLMTIFVSRGRRRYNLCISLHGRDNVSTKGKGESVNTLVYRGAAMTRMTGLTNSLCSVMLIHRQVGGTKLPVGVTVSLNGCLSVCVNPVIDWRPVQGEPRLLPSVSWDQLQPLGLWYRQQTNLQMK